MSISPTRPRFVSIDEAKQRLCLGTTAIYAFINAGELRRVKLGRKVVFLETDLVDFINRKVAEATPAAA